MTSEQSDTLETRVVVRGSDDTTDAERENVRQWQIEGFADIRDVLDTISWHDGRGLGFNIQTYHAGQFVGFAHVFTRLAEADGASLLIGGLSGVVTDPSRQGEGIGTTTVRQAQELILQNFRADLGVLLCMPKLVPFYSNLGWVSAPGSVTVAQPEGTVPWSHACMLLPTAPKQALPQKLYLGWPF